jgi:hypothetical protein
VTAAAELKGGCLCGAVRFAARPKAREFGACHCSMCRRWTAGPFLTVDCETAFTIEDDSSLGLYRSSDWAERGYCKACGTPLFYRLIEPGLHFVSLEAFDDKADFLFASQIFIDEKPAHYAFANETATLTGAEVFAAFAPGGGQG